MSLRWAFLGALVLSGSCKFFDPNENCLNPRSACFTPQTVAPYVVSYVPVPNRGSNTVSKLEGIQVTFSQRIKGWLDPDNYELANMGSLKIASIEQAGTYTVTLKLSGKLANGNVDLSFPGLTNFTSLPFSKGTSLRLIGNLDIGVSILDSTSTHFVSSGGGLAKNTVALSWNHDFRIDPQNNNSYALKVGGSSCADASAISGGTNITGSNLPGNTAVTSTIPLSGNFNSSGTYFVRICVQNNSGFNKSGEAVVVVINDSNAPVLQADISSGAYAMQQSVAIRCTDNCVRIAYKVATGASPQGAPSVPTFNNDGSVQTGTEFTGSWITPYTGDSTHSTLIAVAMDNAGNQSAPLVLSYEINASLPVISFGSPAMTRSYVSGNSAYDSTTIRWQSNQSGNYQICLGGSGCSTGPSCGSGATIGSVQAYTAGSWIDTEIQVNGSPALANGSNSIHVCMSNGVKVADSSLTVHRSDTAPTITSVNPGDVTNAIPSAAPVTITIADPLDLDMSTVTINSADSSCTGTFQISLASDDFAPNTCVQMVSQPVALSAKTFMLKAAGGFNPGIYKVRITTGLKDIAGNSLAATYTMSTGFAASGLLRQYTFNNDSTDLEDQAFSGLHLSITGTPRKVTGVHGDKAGAYRFDGTGNGYLNGVDSALPSGQAPRTICAWVNPMARCSTNCVATMYGANSGAYLGNRNATAGYGFPAISDSVGATSLRLNTWMHLCQVYDGNNLKVFLNGIQDGAGSGIATTLLGNGIFVGKPSHNSGQSAFYGGIDDVRIYAGALTESAVRQMAIQVPTSLEVYYSFSDATSQTANDFSNNGHLGTLAGNPTPVADRFGNTGAYNFSSANQWISASDTGLPADNTSRTICTWISPASLPSAGNYATVFRYGNPASGAAQTLGIYNNGGASVLFYGAWGDEITTSQTISLNTWMHLCGTYDGTLAAIYVNGTLMNSGTKNWNTTLMGSGGIYVGQGNNSGTTAFNGAIDDVRVHSRVLTQNEITVLSLQLSSGLVRQYSFLNGQLSEDNGGPGLNAVGNPTLGTGADSGNNGAFTFNGSSQYLSGSDLNLPAGNAARTLCARVNPVNVGLSAFALSYGSTVPGENSFLFMGGVTGVSFGNLSNNLTTPTSLPANSWSHICGIFDENGKATIYLNGKVPSGGGPSNFSFATVLNGQFAVGARSDSAFRWAGKLDDIRIYTRALSALEITELEGY